jgi:hypothetical protein
VTKVKRILIIIGGLLTLSAFAYWLNENRPQWMTHCLVDTVDGSVDCSFTNKNGTPTRFIAFGFVDGLAGVRENRSTGMVEIKVLEYSITEVE